MVCVCVKILRLLITLYMSVGSRFVAQAQNSWDMSPIQ